MEALDSFLASGAAGGQRNGASAMASHNEGEMLLHQDAVKTNFYNGKPSDEANKLNRGMVKTFMSFSQSLNPDDALEFQSRKREPEPIAYR